MTAADRRKRYGALRPDRDWGLTRPAGFWMPNIDRPAVLFYLETNVFSDVPCRARVVLSFSKPEFDPFFSWRMTFLGVRHVRIAIADYMPSRMRSTERDELRSFPAVAYRVDCWD